MPEWRPMPEILTLVLIVLRLTYMSGPLRAGAVPRIADGSQKDLTRFISATYVFRTAIGKRRFCGRYDPQLWLSDHTISVIAASWPRRLRDRARVFSRSRACRTASFRARPRSRP